MVDVGTEKRTWSLPFIWVDVHYPRLFHASIGSEWLFVYLFQAPLWNFEWKRNKSNNYPASSLHTKLHQLKTLLHMRRNKNAQQKVSS